MKSLNRKLDIEEVTENSVVSTISQILSSTTGEFTTLYKKSLNMSPADKKYTETMMALDSIEKELILTIKYWTPDVEAEDMIARIKGDINRERGII